MNIKLNICSPSDLRLRLEEFAEILCDAVAGGASVGFLHPLSLDAATKWWANLIPEVESGSIILLGAFLEDKLVGTVQLHPSTKENAPHRGEIAKLMVLSSARKMGLGKKLMLEIEEIAIRMKKTLLVLDTEVASPAESLYRSLGYNACGTIPEYSLLPTGKGLASTCIMWKRTTE